MTILPVVARELRVAARQGGSYWGRFFAALVAIIVFGWIFLLERGGGNRELGKVLFVALSVLAYLFAALAGVLFSADSVSSEKREGTLGLLFLTDLRGYDVALGKLTASSLAAVYALLSTLPVLALCWLLGAVEAAEYWRVVLTLLAVLFTSLGLGLFASTLTADPWRAGLLAFLLILLWQLGLPTVWAVAEYSLRNRLFSREELEALWEACLRYCSPIEAMQSAFADNYKTQAATYWTSLTVCVTAGFALLGLASWRLPRIWQEGAVEGRRGLSARLRGLRFPDAAAVLRFRTRLLESHPVVWLAGRHWLRAWLVWATVLAVVGGYVGLAELEGDNDWWEPPALVLLSYGLHLLLKLWIALEAPRQFYEDRRSGALELLLTTPVRVEEAVRARVQALRRQFLGPFLLVLAGDWLVMIFAWDSGKDDDFMHWLLAWGVHMLTLLFDGYTLAWYGNWLGLAATGKRTTFHAVLRVLLLPWILWIAGVTLFAVADGPRGLGGDDALLLSLLSWVTCGAGANLLWLHRARRGLLQRFREVAVQPVRQRRAT